MTSKVTVETYNYPVLVEELLNSANNPSGQWKAHTAVQPFSKVDFTLCSGQQFKVTELPAFVIPQQPKTAVSAG
jgi:hypothetical protein